MKTKHTVIIAILCAISFIANAKKIKIQSKLIGHVTLLKRTAQVSVGAGKMNTSALTQTKSNKLGDLEVLGNVYVPILGTGWGESKIRTSLGVTLGAGVTANNNTADKITFPPNAFHPNGIAVGPVVPTQGSEVETTNVLMPFLGLQANVHIGKIMLSPSINWSSINRVEKSSEAKQDYSYNGTTTAVLLQQQSPTITKGLVSMPKLKLTYWLNNRIAIWAEGTSLLGPEITTQILTLQPAGEPDASGNYNLEQITAGKLVNTTPAVAKYKAVGGGLGVTIALGQKLDYIGHVTLLR